MDELDKVGSGSSSSEECSSETPGCLVGREDDSLAQAASAVLRSFPAGARVKNLFTGTERPSLSTGAAIGPSARMLSTSRQLSLSSLVNSARPLWSTTPPSTFVSGPATANEPAGRRSGGIDEATGLVVEAAAARTPRDTNHAVPDKSRPGQATAPPGPTGGRPSSRQSVDSACSPSPRVVTTSYSSRVRVGASTTDSRAEKGGELRSSRGGSAAAASRDSRSNRLDVRVASASSLARCSVCEAAFTVLLRPHRCRVCRRTVCAPCSPARVPAAATDDCVRACKRCTGASAPRVVKPPSAQTDAPKPMRPAIAVTATPVGVVTPRASVSRRQSANVGSTARVRVVVPPEAVAVVGQGSVQTTSAVPRATRKLRRDGAGRGAPGAGPAPGRSSSGRQHGRIIKHDSRGVVRPRESSRLKPGSQRGGRAAIDGERRPIASATRDTRRPSLPRTSDRDNSRSGVDARGEVSASSSPLSCARSALLERAADHDVEGMNAHGVEARVHESGGCGTGEGDPEASRGAIAPGHDQPSHLRHSVAIEREERSELPADPLQERSSSVDTGPASFVASTTRASYAREPIGDVQLDREGESQRGFEDILEDHSAQDRGPDVTSQKNLDLKKFEEGPRDAKQGAAHEAATSVLYTERESVTLVGADAKTQGDSRRAEACLSSEQPMWDGLPGGFGAKRFDSGVGPQGDGGSDGAASTEGTSIVSSSELPEDTSATRDKSQDDGSLLEMEGRGNYHEDDGEIVVPRGEAREDVSSGPPVVRIRAQSDRTKEQGMHLVTDEGPPPRGESVATSSLPADVIPGNTGVIGLGVYEADDTIGPSPSSTSEHGGNWLTALKGVLQKARSCCH